MGSFVSLKVYKQGVQFSIHFVKIVRHEGPLYVQIRNLFPLSISKSDDPSFGSKNYCFLIVLKYQFKKCEGNLVMKVANIKRTIIS